MFPSFRDRTGRVHTTVGAALGLVSLGCACWLICQPAAAILDPGSSIHAAAPAPRGIVVSNLRSVARVVDAWSPIPEEFWRSTRILARVTLDDALAHSLVARQIPSAAQLRLDTEPGDLDATIGSVTRLDDGRLRVIDGWSSGGEHHQVELRLAAGGKALPSVEGSVVDIRSGEDPEAWTELTLEVATSRSTWSSRDVLHLRYRAQGLDHAGRKREVGGLVRVVVP